jgi:hypothetical protein
MRQERWRKFGVGRETEVTITSRGWHVTHGNEHTGQNGSDDQCVQEGGSHIVTSELHFQASPPYFTSILHLHTSLPLLAVFMSISGGFVVVFVVVCAFYTA